MRLRNLLTICVILLLAPCSAYSQEVTPGRAPGGPNVVLIIADDLAWDDTGAYGNTEVRTPNIDRLAREGMRFTRAFVTISSCSPNPAQCLGGADQ